MRSLCICLLLATVITLSGCGVRFAYNQLDWLVPWYLRDFVSLDDRQRALLEQRLLIRLEWHCGTQLPRYAIWLREVEADLVSGDVSVEGLSAHARRAEGFWRDLAGRLTGDAAVILAGAPDDQITELFDNLDRRMAENRERFVDRPPDVQQQERAERMERRLRRWFGRMNAAQQARIEAWSAGIAPFGEQWLENRALWQAQLREILTNLRHDPVALEAALSDLMVYPELSWSEDYRALVAYNRDQTLALLVDLYRLAPERQRERLIDRTASLARDFERLTCEAPSETALDARERGVTFPS